MELLLIFILIFILICILCAVYFHKHNDVKRCKICIYIAIIWCIIFISFKNISHLKIQPNTEVDKIGDVEPEIESELIGYFANDDTCEMYYNGNKIPLPSFSTNAWKRFTIPKFKKTDVLNIRVKKQVNGFGCFIGVFYWNNNEYLTKPNSYFKPNNNGDGEIIKVPELLFPSILLDPNQLIPFNIQNKINQGLSMIWPNGNYVTIDEPSSYDLFFSPNFIPSNKPYTDTVLTGFIINDNGTDIFYRDNKLVKILNPQNWHSHMTWTTFQIVDFQMTDELIFTCGSYAIIICIIWYNNKLYVTNGSPNFQTDSQSLNSICYYNDMYSIFSNYLTYNDNINLPTQDQFNNMINNNGLCGIQTQSNDTYITFTP